uniref:Membrane protein n=1 Tax=Tolypothrix bouteillei VB521301 TaxID=1479485 RepID=A0A0C1NKR3_9CYAN
MQLTPNLDLETKSELSLVFLLGSIFFVLCLLFTLHRYYSFYASFDQGIFNQVFWNNLHGRFFQSSLSSSLSTNVVHSGEVASVYYHRLGQHFTPALLLWLPIYALFPSPATLTVLQVTLITAAGLVLYVLARQYIEPPIAVMITASYYAANAVIGPTLSNFHDISQIPLFFFGLFLAMEKRWWKLFWVLAIFILAVREDSGVGLFGVGVYMILSKRFPRAGLAVCTLSFGYMLVLTNAIMPLFSEDISRRFMLERFGQYADGDKASTLDIIWGMIRNPWRLIVEFVTPVDKTIKYLLGQWLPLAFVPAVAPASWTIAGFPLLKLFLGKGESVLAITIRYALTVVPGLFYGSILWWSQHRQSFKPSFRRFWVGCICLSLVLSVTSNPNKTFYFVIPDSIKPWVYVSLPQQWHHVSEFRPLLSAIPSNASVSATTFLVPHLSSRREILRLPALQVRNDAREVIKVDYAIADLWQLQQYQPAFKGERGLLRELVTLIDQISGDGEYGIIGFRDGVILLKKATASDAQATAAWSSFRQQLQPILQQST